MILTARWAVVVAVLVAAPAFGRQEPVPTAADVTAAIEKLGSLDAYEIRMEAARTVRRAPPEVAVPLLDRAVRGHKDEYIRFRALVLLSGFSQPATRDLMRQVLTDRNDRVRTVAAAWFEHHPDRDALPVLLETLKDEASEFVRPALTRAVAAHGDDPRVREALAPLVSRGEDYFRGAVIEALGEYRAAYALPAIEAVARLDGPLQDDGITAIGRIGETSRVGLLVELQRTVGAHLQPTVSASICLLGLNCAAHKRFVTETLQFAAGASDRQALLRGAVHAAGMLALGGHDDALAALFAVGLPASEQSRAPIALGVGRVALRNPSVLLKVLAASDRRNDCILILRDAFDMLNEDFEEERFFVTVRRAYWAAPAGSPERALAEALIRVLEF